MDYAALKGDLPRVQRMLGDGEAHITDTDLCGFSALLNAAMGFTGSDAISTLKWLLEEGGARISERDPQGYSAHLLAANNGRIAACQWL
jgi:ankyrin repeat protein